MQPTLGVFPSFPSTTARSFFLSLLQCPVSSNLPYAVRLANLRDYIRVLSCREGCACVEKQQVPPLRLPVLAEGQAPVGMTASISNRVS